LPDRQAAGRMLGGRGKTTDPYYHSSKNYPLSKALRLVLT